MVVELSPTLSNLTVTSPISNNSSVTSSRSSWKCRKVWPFKKVWNSPSMEQLTVFQLKARIKRISRLWTTIRTTIAYWRLWQNPNRQNSSCRTSPWLKELSSNNGSRKSRSSRSWGQWWNEGRQVVSRSLMTRLSCSVCSQRCSNKVRSVRQPCPSLLQCPPTSSQRLSA